MANDLMKLLEVNRTFMALEHEINAALMSTFLAVAVWSEGREESVPLTIVELAKRVGLPGSTVSRHLRYLGKRRRKGVPGLGLVDTALSGDDARQKAVSLTPEGMALRDRLLGVAA